jgi:Ca2+-binding EF-hand superfamily protein
MESSEGKITIEVLRSMAERVGLHLSDEELAEIQRIYDPTQVAALRTPNLEPLEPASIFIPAS